MVVSAPEIQTYTSQLATLLRLLLLLPLYISLGFMLVSAPKIQTHTLLRIYFYFPYFYISNIVLTVPLGQKNPSHLCDTLL